MSYFFVCKSDQSAYTEVALFILRIYYIFSTRKHLLFLFYKNTYNQCDCESTIKRVYLLEWKHCLRLFEWISEYFISHCRGRYLLWNVYRFVFFFFILIINSDKRNVEITLARVKREKCSTDDIVMCQRS